MTVAGCGIRAALIRTTERLHAGLFTLHAVNVALVNTLADLGRKLAVCRA